MANIPDGWTQRSYPLPDELIPTWMAWTAGMDFKYKCCAGAIMGFMMLPRVLQEALMDLDEPKARRLLSQWIPAEEEPGRMPSQERIEECRRQFADMQKKKAEKEAAKRFYPALSSDNERKLLERTRKAQKRSAKARGQKRAGRAG